MGEDVCITACRQAGWIGELLVFVFLAARAAWSEYRRRQLAADNGALKERVKTLSDSPPPASMPAYLLDDRLPGGTAPSANLRGMVLHIPGVSLYPSVPTPGMQDSLRPESDKDPVG